MENKKSLNLSSGLVSWVLASTISLCLSIAIYAKDGNSVQLVIYTVNYPLKYFAKRIAGDHAKVIFPTPPGVDPAFWMPDTITISGYQQADIILLNGAGYAKWVNKATLSAFRIVDTSAGFQHQFIAVDDAVTHSHGPGGDHSHTGSAFTTWLDFSQAVQQAMTIMHALSKKLPAHKTDFESNYAELKKDLLMLDSEIKAMVATKPRHPLIASHPVYQYFTRRYELNLESVMWEPDHVPDQAEWATLKNRLRRHPANWMIWESEPLPESVERLRSMGVSSLVFNPSGSTPEKGDFISVMRQNLSNFKVVFDNPEVLQQ